MAELKMYFKKALITIRAFSNNNKLYFCVFTVFRV